jgi:hypothetical protein
MLRFLVFVTGVRVTSHRDTTKTIKQFLILLIGLSALLMGGAHAEEEEKPLIDYRKFVELAEAKKVTLYMYSSGSSFPQMSEEKFVKEACAYESTDAKSVIAMTRLLSSSKLKKDKNPYYPHRQNIWFSNYGVKFELTDGSIAWLLLGSEGSYGEIRGSFTQLPEYDKYPVIAAGLLAYSMKLWAATLGKALTESCRETLENTNYRY